MKTLLATLALVLAAAPALAQEQAPAQAVGVVRAIDAKAASVTIAHEPIEALGWPAMTMSFKVQDRALLQGVSVGQKVDFQLQGQTIVALKPRVAATGS